MKPMICVVCKNRLPRNTHNWSSIRGIGGGKCCEGCDTKFHEQKSRAIETRNRKEYITKGWHNRLRNELRL